MSQFGICDLPVIPIREKPSHRSEMISQALFGDCFEIVERQEHWSLIKLAYDEYEGWIDTKQITIISAKSYQEQAKITQSISDLSSHAILMKLGHDEMLHLLPGSTLPMMKEEGLFQIEGTEYMFLGLSRTPEFSNFTEEVEEASRFYLNAPYLWGGRTLFGIDCSGFSQIVCKHFGIKIPRDASQQALKGETIHLLKETIPGDLAFFGDEESKITHVGIIISNSEIIHASGKVRIDKIDENGIFDLENQKYTHKLRLIKRFVH